MKFVVCNHLATLNWNKRHTADLGLLLGHSFIRYIKIPYMGVVGFGLKLFSFKTFKPTRV